LGYRSDPANGPVLGCRSDALIPGPAFPFYFLFWNSIIRVPLILFLLSFVDPLRGEMAPRLAALFLFWTYFLFWMQRGPFHVFFCFVGPLG